MDENSIDPLAELGVMKAVAEALSPLDQDSAARVLRWATERFGGALRVGEGSGSGQHKTVTVGDVASEPIPRFSSLAELHAEANPKTDADRALLAGYWLQYLQGQPDFGSQAINTALKNLGHGVANITGAFDSLKAQKPALVIQLKKAGISKQARKTYKLTTAGKNVVDQMIDPSQ